MALLHPRNYIHAERGDHPAERQVTWRGCARDWITQGEREMDRQRKLQMDKWTGGPNNRKMWTEIRKVVGQWFCR